MTALDVIAGVCDVLSWLGWLVVVASGLALVVLVAGEGPWHRVEAVVEHERPVLLRWFGKTGVGEAVVPHADLDRVTDRSSVDVFVRADRHDAFRWERKGPMWRPVLWTTLGATAFAVVTTVVSFLPRMLA